MLSLFCFPAGADGCGGRGKGENIGCSGLCFGVLAPLEVWLAFLKVCYLVDTLDDLALLLLCPFLAPLCCFDSCLGSRRLLLLSLVQSGLASGCCHAQEGLVIALVIGAVIILPPLSAMALTQPSR